MKRVFFNSGFTAFTVFVIVSAVSAQTPPKAKKQTGNGPLIPRATTQSRMPSEYWAHLDALLAPGQRAEKQARDLLKLGKLQEAERACVKAKALYRTVGGDMGFFRSEAVSTTLGDVYLAENQYQKALDNCAVVSKYSSSNMMSLNIALCYVRLGKYSQARQFYSDEAILEQSFSTTVRDLPGTRTSQTLEASILLARGIEEDMSGEKDEAFKEFTAALKLVPNNGWAAYHAARALWYGGRQSEAAPYFVKAVQNGHGEFVDEARRYVPAALQDQIANVPKTQSRP